MRDCFGRDDSNSLDEWNDARLAREALERRVASFNPSQIIKENPESSTD